MKRRSFRYRVRQIWNWSLLLTVPVGLTFLVWLFSVGQRYRELGLRYEVVPNQSILLQPIMEIEWHKLKRQAALFWKSNAGSDAMPSVHLWLADREEQQLNQRLPKSGKEYVEGSMLYPDGQLRSVSLRYRGDTAWHWALDKRSWRVKTKKDQLWNGVRRFNLVIPKSEAMVEMQMSFWLAQSLGCLTPRSQLSELSINGRNQGVYVLVEQLDEQFLRSQKRMPGDLYAGEFIGEGELRQWPNRLFDYPGAWDKAAINNHFDDDHYEPLQRLCAAVQADAGERLEALIDVEAFARFAVLRTLMQTGHVDEYHNWRLYYDPWRNVFEPLVWDPMGWMDTWAPNAHHGPFDWPLFSDLDRALVQRPAYRLAAYRVWQEFFSGGLAEEFLAEWDAAQEQVLAAAQHDPHMAFAIRPLSPQDVEQAGQRVRLRLEEYLDFFRAELFEAPAIVRWDLQDSPDPESIHLELEVDGKQPIEALLWKAGATDRPAPQVECFDDEHGVWRMVRTERLGADWVATFAQPLLPALIVQADNSRGVTFTHVSEPAPQKHWLRIAGDVGGLTEEKSLRVRDLRGREGSARNAPLEAPPRSLVNFPQEETPEATRWQGTLELAGVTRIAGDLEIAPGTRVQLAPDASVIVQGRVRAHGSAEAPIRFQRADADQAPWGTFAIRNPQGDQSELVHVHFSGGSGLKEPLEEYSGMLSIHDVDRVTLRHCRFEHSSIVDDMVHIVYSQDLRIEDCTFVRSFADALDLDACSGTLLRCRFERSGNDGVDLMMSQIRIEDSAFYLSGDKGVSVGEGSELVLKNAHVERCAIGVQVKDGSLAWIEGGRFASNPIAWDAIKKNWQYGDGGHGLVWGSEVESSDTIVHADKTSSWQLVDVDLPGDWKGKKRLRSVPAEDWTEGWRSLERFQEGVLVGREFATHSARP